MPHPLAITRNRQALLPIVAAIVALLSGREGLIPRGCAGPRWRCSDPPNPPSAA